MDLKEFKKLLEYHDNLYYNLDAPEIFDVEYDALKQQYLEEAGLEEYDYVPGKADSKKKRIKHPFKVLSLEKVNSIPQVTKEITRLLPVVIQPKLDGLTLIGYDYNTFATRGSHGEEGEIVTDNAKRVGNLGTNEITFGLGPVRMEAIIHNEDFDAINQERIENGEPEYESARNTAAGMVRRSDPDKVKGVSYYAYNIMGSSLSETEQLSLLEKNGFTPVPSVLFDTVEAAVEFIKDFDRNDLNYQIDGLVIKSNLPNSFEHFGVTGHHPKNAVAFKFPSQGVWTTLKDVIFQIGRTGKITPVGIIDPVPIDGSNITRATLHNEAIVKALGLRIGFEVFVVKGNDVIPAITQTRKNPFRDSMPIIFPTHCPKCHSELVQEEDQLFCKNTLCESRIVRNLVHLASRDVLDIEDLSIETAKKMYALDLVKSPYDIFDLVVADFLKLEGFAQKSSKKLYEAIQSRRTVPLKKFLYAACIPLVGRTASENIANRLLTYEDFIRELYALKLGGDSIIPDIEDIGPKICQALIDNADTFEQLREYVTPISVVKLTTQVPDKVLTIVVTGSFEVDGKKVTREEIESMIKEAGHKASGSVSKKTNYVLVGAEAGSKADKAVELGIPIINTINELKEIL